MKNKPHIEPFIDTYILENSGTASLKLSPKKQGDEAITKPCLCPKKESLYLKLVSSDRAVKLTVKLYNANLYSIAY